MTSAHPEERPSEVEGASRRTLPQITLPEIARTELDRRRAKARAAVATRQRTTAQVEPQIRAWTAIALWFRAELPEDITRQLAPPTSASPTSAHPHSAHLEQRSSPSAGSGQAADLQSSVESACRETPTWIDLYPGERADRALLRLAHEARRAAAVALKAHERAQADLLVSAQDRAALQTRATNLLRLDHHLSLAAGLGPFTASKAKAAA